MATYIIEKFAVLTAMHKPTGRTRHFDGGLLGPAFSLAIVCYTDAHGFYLLYFDAEGREMTDTFHATIEEAMTQAKWEYEVAPSDWSQLSS